MAVVTCWALLLLTTLQLQTIAGRHIPAGPPLQIHTAPLLPVPAPPLSRHESRALGAVVLPSDGTQFQDRSPAPDRKMMRRWEDSARDNVSRKDNARDNVGAVSVTVPAA